MPMSGEPDEGVRFTDYALDLLKNQYENHKIKISTYTNSVTIIKNLDKYMKEKEFIKKIVHWWVT